MKQTKRLLAIFLILLTLFQSIPIVYATDSASSTVENETVLSAENGMSQIIENLTESENDENEDYPEGYSISEMTFEENVANVSVNVSDVCKLIVAIYDENTSEMLCSVVQELTASAFSEEKREDIISVEMDVAKMPEHFIAKAFIIDKNNNALCKNFICRIYTTDYEIFTATTPDDFAGKEIVTLDDNCDDFGVLVDGVIVSENYGSMTYTYSDGVYYFYNATEEVKNLKKDDIFYYRISEEIGDFLLIKVKDIKIDGTTVEIIEDEDIALGDAFQFVRIDEEADFSEVELTEDDLGSALSLQQPEQQISLMSARTVYVEKSKTFSTTLNVSYPNSAEEDKNAWDKSYEIKGSLGYSLSASVKLYYDSRPDEDFYEFTTSLTHNVDFNVTFSGKIESNQKYFAIKLPKIPVGGVFDLDVSIYPVLSAEASMTFGGSNEIYNRMSFDDAGGLSKVNETKWLSGDPVLGKTEIEFKLGIGVEFDFGFKKGKKDVEGFSKLHASLSASFEGGIKAGLKPSLIGVLLDKHHSCGFCMDGSVSAFISGKATLKFKIISENLKWSWDAVSLTGTWSVGDCYFSISGDGFSFGFGTCPNISYKVTVNVYDENGDPVEEATVTTTTGCCDADGDGKFEEMSINTDENGQAVFYFAAGNHEVVAKKSDIGTNGQQFEMLSNEKEIYLELFDAEYFNGHWYKVYDISKSWTDAKIYCESLGGHLTTITSQEEQTFIENAFLTDNPQKEFYLVGGYRRNSYSEWKWITGEIFTYSKWGGKGDEANQQTNTSQNYIWIGSFSYTYATPLMWISHDNYNYNDSIWNTRKAGFICEWEAIPSQIQAVSYSLSLYNTADEASENEIEVVGTTAVFTKALKGKEYVLAVIKDENSEDLLSAENLLYIDQKTAGSSAVSFSFTVPEAVTGYCVKIFGISHSHTSAEAVKENEISPTCTSSGSYESVVYCSVCGEEMNREPVSTQAPGHREETITGKAPTCMQTGLTNGIKCTVCSQVLTVQETIPSTDHIDTNGDYKCDYNCGYEFENPVDSCSHLCHKKGFMGFIWKIIRFFIKLLRTNKVCSCGAYHW